MHSLERILVFWGSILQILVNWGSDMSFVVEMKYESCSFSLIAKSANFNEFVLGRNNYKKIKIHPWNFYLINDKTEIAYSVIGWMNLSTSHNLNTETCLVLKWWKQFRFAKVMNLNGIWNLGFSISHTTFDIWIPDK